MIPPVSTLMSNFQVNIRPLLMQPHTIATLGAPEQKRQLCKGKLSAANMSDLHSQQPDN
jgi:hypothetical protein